MAGVRFPVTENNLFALRGSCSGVSVVGRSDMEVFFFSLDSAEEPGLGAPRASGVARGSRGAAFLLPAIASQEASF